MAKETKTVSLRLPVEQVEWLMKNEESINQAIVNAIDRLRIIEKYAERDIAGKFTPEEWSYLADALNGTIAEGDFRYRSFALIAQIEDCAEYDGLDKKWNVDVKQFCEKVKGLSSASIDAIFRRVEKYWNEGKEGLGIWANY